MHEFHLNQCSVCVCLCVCLYVLSTHKHAQHLCWCSALQRTGLGCWCWRCLRFWRSAACEWRGASATDPVVTTANQRRAHTCWCCSAERPSPIWCLHPKTSSIFTPHGKTTLHNAPSPPPPTLTPNTGPCWTWFWFLSKLLWKLVTTQ